MRYYNKFPTERLIDMYKDAVFVAGVSSAGESTIFAIEAILSDRMHNGDERAREFFA